MAKVYDNPITLSTDWGGDATTGNKPVSGKRVQELIKNTFAQKGGCVQVKDKKFLQVFADAESMALYNENSDKYAELLLSQVQLPNTGATQATMKVTVNKTPNEYTTEGTPELFEFRYVSYYEDMNDLSAVSGTLTLSVGGLQKLRMSLRAGNDYSVDVSKYLGNGTSEVKFVIDNAEGSSRSYVYEVTKVTLEIQSTFDYVTPKEGAFDFVYTPVGNVLKTVHIAVDGKEVHTEATEANNRQLTTQIAAQSHGAHVISTWLTAEIGGLDITSKTVSFAVICIESGNTTPIIASPVTKIEMTQYETVAIPFVAYDPENSPASVTLSKNRSTVSTREVDRTEQKWIYRANEEGGAMLEIKCRDTTKSFSLTVNPSIITSEAETQNLDLFLTSQGRSNQDENHETWKSDNIQVAFEGMNWSTNGWITDDSGSTAMRLNGGASLSIPVKPFSKDIRQTGMTIELEFAVRQVTDYSSTILSCLQGGIGLQLTPNTISLHSEQSAMETKYKEDERVRVSFVIEKRAANRLMQIYINGIKSQSLQYPDNDGFTQAEPVNITAVGDTATLDVYNIRVYSNNLNTRQILDNYIADMDDIDKKIAVFKRNQVYDTYGNLSYAALLEQNPILVITGELSQYKGDKKTVSMEYVDRANPAKSFTAEGVELNVQGTSSQYYPRKNYKGTFKQGFTMTSTGEHADNFTLNEDAVLPAHAFCWKADFAESSGTHNTGLANYIGWMLREAKILTVPQKSNALVRTTVYGEPCLIFHKDTAESTPVFIGKYNFNTDKSAENTFGFSDGDESWEFLNNTSERSLFQSADFTGDAWKNDFEGRYPDGNEDIANMKRVFEWVVSCKGNVEKFKSEFDTYFDKKQLVFYDLITLVFGMVDQRAKNQFLTMYHGGQWLFIFYDNDTVFGINNEGAIAFSYNVELKDVIGNLNVYNGANSLLWELVEKAFADDIKAMYKDLRQKGILSYDKVMEYCNTRQSDKWCEAVYNEDGYYKYESPLIDGYVDYSSGSPQTLKTGAYLYALQGSRDAHRRWWLFNRFKYMDSKFQAGTSLSDYITFRTYTPSEWSGVEPRADITLGTFTAMYGTIKWGSITKSERMSEGEVRTITAPTGTKFNDTETIIYNASMLKSVGDLSALYVGTVDVSKATNITELIIGSAVSGYQNKNFTVLSLGTNHVLRKLDIQNCPNFTANIDVTGCEAIEEIYAKGSGTTAVNLPEGGALRVMQLPATITNLTLKNQPNLGIGLTLESWQNIIALVIENCPKINAFARVKTILASKNALQRVRLTGVNANESNFAILNTLANLKGIGDNGEFTERAYISGKYNVATSSEDEIASMKALFPYLAITATTILKSYTVTFVVKSQYGNIKDATVTINGQTYSLANGQAAVKLTQDKTYPYTITYDGGKTDSGSVDVGTQNIKVTKTYQVDFDAMTMKPEPNGKIQFLVSGMDVRLSLAPGYSELSVDWGDGTIDTEDSHTYMDNVSFHNISVDVKAETINIGTSGTLIAVWTIGNTNAYWETFENKNKLQYVGGDVFKNDTNTTLLRKTFRGTKALKSIPSDIFANYTKLEYFGDAAYGNDWGIFLGSGLTEIPTGLFDSCTKIKKVGNSFASTKIKIVPEDLFDKCSQIMQFNTDYSYTAYKGTFAGCKELEIGRIPIGDNIEADYGYTYQNCPMLKTLICNSDTPCNINSSSIPNNADLKIYVPDSAIDTYKSATNWSAFADKIVGMSTLPSA